MKEVATGTLESIGQGVCRISGIDYKVPDYVIPFLNRRKAGEEVEYSFTEGEAGRRLTKIAKPFKKTGEVPAKPQPAPQLHHVKVIKVNEVALKYDNLSEDPRMKGIRTITLTPVMFGVFTEAGIKEGDEIDILIDAQGMVSLPPQPKDAHLQENLDRMDGPADGETVEPPGGELIKAPTTPPEKVTEAPQGKPSEETTTDKDRAYRWDLTLGGTINLQNYENLKVELSGPACDREQMKAYLGGTLDLFGTGNPATRELIEGYKRRVL